MGSLAEDVADVMGDFPSFCELLEIKLVSGGGMVRFGWGRWYPEQRKFELDRSGKDIVIKPRQVGFSTLELARDLHRAVTRTGYQVLVVVHDDKLKKDLFFILRMMAQCLKRKGLLPKTAYSTTTELVFADTGSAVRIVEAGKTERAAEGKGRSGTINRLHATEMAFWGQAETTWNSLTAAVPPEGEVVIESTANGAGGLFYEMVREARAGRGEYKFHFFAWFEQRRYRLPPPLDFDPAPRDKWEVKLRQKGCDDQQIAWWRSKFGAVDIGPEKTLQEYPVDPESCFRTSGRQYFAADLIDDLNDRIDEPIEVVDVKWQGRVLGQLLVYERPEQPAWVPQQRFGFRRIEPPPAEEYIVGGDVSEGTGNDAHALTVVAKRSARTCAVFWSDSIEPGDLGLAAAVIGAMYNQARIAIERNNHGHAALRALVTEAKYPRGRIYATKDGKLGWSTDQVTRPIMVDDLGGAVRTGLAWTPDRETLGEMKTLVRNEKGKVEARGKSKSTKGKGACKDDRWMSWCIAWQVRTQPSQEITPAETGI